MRKRRGNRPDPRQNSGEWRVQLCRRAAQLDGLYRHHQLHGADPRQAFHDIAETERRLQRLGHDILDAVGIATWPERGRRRPRGDRRQDAFGDLEQGREAIGARGPGRQEHREATEPFRQQSGDPRRLKGRDHAHGARHGFQRDGQVRGEEIAARYDLPSCDQNHRIVGRAVDLAR